MLPHVPRSPSMSSHRRRPTSPTCFTHAHDLRRRASNRRSRLRHLPTMYCTGKPSQVEQPAAIRCKPSRPRMPVPQAPSFDAVPRHTDSCQATPAAAVRCKQPQPTNMRQPPTAATAANAATRARQHPFSLPLLSIIVVN